jgi:hypothetical protein
MAAQKKTLLKEINLLPKEEFAMGTWGRILKWLLSTFRIIVVLVEVMVMGAFLSRFWLDARSSDLNDQIKQRQGVIAAFAETERDFRDAQNKLSVFAAVSPTERKSLPLIESITSFLPPDVLLSSITFVKDSFQVKAETVNELSIAQYLVNLEAADKFKEIALVQLGSSEEGSGLTFVVKITPK